MKALLQVQHRFIGIWCQTNKYLVWCIKPTSDKCSICSWFYRPLACAGYYKLF